MDSEPKTYEIETLNQLINVVTPENFERLSVEFLTFLGYCTQFFAELKKKEEYKDKLNSDIADVKFTWTDDGEIKLANVKCINTKTGEVTTIIPNNP
ncbi:MAG: hypothetical protein BWY67_00730 [Bacteroidetes bacterium ADurb.Bin397]|nr:MAG: hypothetical protein BWY67_00730 [Bacteroidetes bacterium ADurb.Bin397]